MTTDFRFGTVGSPISTPKKPGGSVGAVKQISTLGLSALELGWVQSVRVSPETCGQIKATAAELDVAISVHAPYFINLNADVEEWPKSRKRLMDAAYYGWLAGATDIIFHPGSYFGQDPSQVLKVVISRLQDCVEELNAKQIDVTLRPETMGKSAMLGSLEDTLRMSMEVDRVAPCIDFAHLHARPGDGSLNSMKEWEVVINGYAHYLGNKSLSNLHIHLSGIDYGPKGEKNHLALLESDLRIRELLSILKSSGCSGRILCESPVMEDDALLMKKMWENLS